MFARSFVGKMASVVACSFCILSAGYAYEGVAYEGIDGGEADLVAVDPGRPNPGVANPPPVDNRYPYGAGGGYAYPQYPYPGYGPLYNPNAFPDSTEFQNTYERNAHPPR